MNTIYIKILSCISFMCCCFLLQAQTVTISGTISTIANNPLEQVSIFTSIDGAGSTVTSDINGYYEIEAPIGSDISLNLVLTGDIKEGLTFRDILNLRKFILGIGNTELEPWQVLAADMNNSALASGVPMNGLDGISTFDLVLMSQIILNQNDSYDSDWKFYSTDLDAVNLFEFSNVSTDLPNTDITGVKLGNLDCH